MAEDHQTKNALALSTRNAAVLVPDAEAREKLADTVLALLAEPGRLRAMGEAAAALAQRDSDLRIARMAIGLIKPRAKS